MEPKTGLEDFKYSFTGIFLMWYISNISPRLLPLSSALHFYNSDDKEKMRNEDTNI